MAHVCRLEFYGFNNGFFEKLIGRQHRSFRFSENRVFCTHFGDKQTDEQTNRWTASMRKAAFVIARGGLIRQVVVVSTSSSVIALSNIVNAECNMF